MNLTLTPNSIYRSGSSQLFIKKSKTFQHISGVDTHTLSLFNLLMLTQIVLKSKAIKA